MSCSKIDIVGHEILKKEKKHRTFPADMPIEEIIEKLQIVAGYSIEDVYNDDLIEL